MASEQKSEYGSIINLKYYLDTTKIDENSLIELASLLHICLLQEVSSDHWELLCNGLVCLLYYSLHFKYTGDNSSVTSICKIFQQRWFNFEAEDCPILVAAQQRLSCYGTVILLFNHHYPNASILQYRQDILKMPNGTILLPKTLVNSLNSNYNRHQELNVLLFDSICCLFKLPVYDVELDNSYYKPFRHFFIACQCYREEKYVESINYLKKIDIEICSRLLGGWVYAMMGLNFYHLKKYQVALRNFHISFVHANNCLISLYFTAKCFKAQNNHDAELDSLRIFDNITEHELDTDDSLHGVLLSYHQPPQHMVPQIKLLLAVSQVKYMQLQGAKAILIELLSMDRGLYSKEIPSFLRVNDLPPPLLPYRAIECLLLLVKLMENDEVSDVLSRLPPIDGVNITLESRENSLEELSILASYVLKVNYLKDKYANEAVKLATRLELITVTLTGAEGDPICACFCVIKKVLYKYLIDMHIGNGNCTTATYYKKLLKSLKAINFDSDHDSGSETSKILLEIVHNYFIKLA